MTTRKFSESRFGTPRNTIALIGDSTASVDVIYNAAGYKYLHSRATMHALCSMLGWSMRFQGAWGFSGQRSEYILSQFDSTIGALDPKPGYVCVAAGLNSVSQIATSGKTVDDYESDIREFLAKIRALGAVPIFRTLVPIGAPSTTVQVEAWFAFNRVLKKIAQENRDVILFEWDKLWVDTDPTKTYPVAIGDYVDVVGGFPGPHQSTLGTWLAVQRDAQTLIDRGFVVQDIFPPWGKKQAKTETDSPNLYHYGTGGGSAGSVTGTISDNWYVTCNQASGVTSASAVVSKVARTDLNPPGTSSYASWLQIAYTGPSVSPTLNQDYIQLQNNGGGNTIPVGSTERLNVGDDFQMFVEFEMDDAPVNLYTIELICFLNNSTGYTRMYSHAQDGQPTLVNKPFGSTKIPACVMATPAYTIPPGTTSISPFIRGHCSAANGSFTFRIGRVFIEKVPDYGRADWIEN